MSTSRPAISPGSERTNAATSPPRRAAERSSTKTRTGPANFLTRHDCQPKLRYSEPNTVRSKPSISSASVKARPASPEEQEKRDNETERAERMTIAVDDADCYRSTPLIAAHRARRKAIERALPRLPDGVIRGAGRPARAARGRAPIRSMSAITTRNGDGRSETTAGSSKNSAWKDSSPASPGSPSCASARISARPLPASISRSREVRRSAT